MRQRLMVTVVVAAAAIAIAGLAIWLWTSSPNPGAPCDTSQGDGGQAAGPTATTTGEEYWTEERMSSARGAPMPVPGDC